MQSFYLVYLINLNNWFFNIFFFIALFSLFLPSIYGYSVLLSSFLLIVYWGDYTYLNFLQTPFLIKPLMVGTITIHPIIFYTLLVIFFIVLFYTEWQTLTTLRLSFYNMLSLNLITLALGGLWGLQSITWGFIWSNDKIEWLLLYLIIYISVKVHEILHKKTLFFLYFSLVFFNNLFLLRLNILVSRHSFLTSDKLNYILLTTYFLVFIAAKLQLSTKLFQIRFDIFKQILWISFYVVSSSLVYIFFFKNTFVLLMTFFLLNWVYFSKKLIHTLSFLFIYLWLSYFYPFMLLFNLANSFKNLSFDPYIFDSTLSLSRHFLFSDNMGQLDLLETVCFYNKNAVNWQKFMPTFSINLSFINIKYLIFYILLILF